MADKGQKTEDKAIRLARDVYQSILEAVIPQPLMESVGKAIVSEKKWEKLTAQEKIALFRVASILEGKLEPPEEKERVGNIPQKVAKAINGNTQEAAEPTDGNVAGDNVATSEVK